MSQEQRWWVGIAGQAVGPWTQNEVKEALTAARITIMTLVCPVGGQTWSPLQNIPELQSTLHSLPPVLQGTPVLPSSSAFETNPYSIGQLLNNTVSNWKFEIPEIRTIITNYCLYVMPIYHGFNLFLAIIFGTGLPADDPAYWLSLLMLILDIPTRVSLIILFWMAGKRWKASLPAAIPLTYAALIVGYARIVLVSAMILAYIPVFDALDDGSDSGLPVSSVLVLLFFTALLAWEIFVTIWLLLYSRILPWTSTQEIAS